MLPTMGYSPLFTRLKVITVVREARGREKVLGVGQNFLGQVLAALVQGRRDQGQPTSSRYCWIERTRIDTSTSFEYQGTASSGRTRQDALNPVVSGG